MSTSPAELDHQEPSPGFGPTFNAPAIGASFQVPSSTGDGGFVWSPIQEPGSKPLGASCAPSPPPESLSIFHSAASPDALPTVIVAILSALPSSNSHAVPELSIPPASP